MKLIVKCKDCREENKAPNYAEDRVNYAKKFGNEFDLKCKQCDKSNEYHVDNIRAVQYSFVEIILNRVAVFGIVTVVSVILKIFFWSSPISWGFLLFPMATLFFIIKNDSKKQLNFNKHKLKGRVSMAGLKR